MNIKKLTIINFSITTYFCLIYLQYYYNITNEFVNFIKELFTIPFLIAQVIFLIISIKQLLKKHINMAFIISVILLVISSFIIFKSFIY